MTFTFGRRPSTDQARWLVAQASRAPSIHNSQPWRFTYRDGAFKLFADPSRCLVATDPEGRELTLSCGAALLSLRLAARKIGLDATTTLLPDLDDPALLARIQVHEGAPAGVAERRAYAALLRRHTRRGGFDGTPLAPDLTVDLQQAAAAEGGTLVYLGQPGQRRRVIQLARAAGCVLAADEEVQAELAAWTPPPDTARRDGVPSRAYSSRPRLAPDELPTRDFDQGRGYGSAEEEPSPPGMIGVLITAGDTQRDWLIAGQALQSVLVRAAEDWAFATLDSQLIEVPDARAELRREIPDGRHPQMLLRFGHARNAMPTPRRPVDDIIDLGAG